MAGATPANEPNPKAYLKTTWCCSPRSCKIPSTKFSKSRLGKAGATPRKPAGRGGKTTDKACKHCGKMHKAPESECWENPANATDEKKRAARVLKLAMQMGEEQNADANAGSADDDGPIPGHYSVL